MIIDGFSHQVPDIDPQETAEWLDSFDGVVETEGRPRAQFLLMKLLERARESQVGFPATVSSPYVNSIPAAAEPWFPGDEDLERRIRRCIRWNAAVMVTRANMRDSGIGGHLSTYASSASLYEVGFNHFFRGKANGTAGDQVYFQGHASPGIYARAYVEGRLGDEELDNFRFEVGGRGLSSYPHPRLMPDWWEFPTVSMGLGPLSAIYQARFNRYLLNRQIADTSESRVWCFVGDGEFDEPETRAALSLAARERLDNLTFVVSCNLQRLDGPVRGNGKIIQELEALLRGCGWNVIKVIWGRRWDELLARDVDGVLVNKMNTTLDGDFQTLATESGAYIREHFFGPDPRLRKMVEHLSDAELQTLPRGGHDYRKLYAAYKAATEQAGAPTAILAKTIKGWTLGPEIEARNATHQIKKMTKEQLRVLRGAEPARRDPRRAARFRGAALLPPTGGILGARVPRLARPGPRRAPAAPCGPRPRADRTAGPGAGRLRRVRARLARPGGLDDDGVREAAPQPAPGPRPRQVRRPDRARRGADVRARRPFHRDEDLCPRRPALHARRRRPAPLLRRRPHGPDPRGGHHRGGRHGQLPGGGHGVRDLVDAHAADLPVLFDVRLPAHRGPDLAVGRRAGHAASSWAARPGARR